MPRWGAASASPPGPVPHLAAAIHWLARAVLAAAGHPAESVRALGTAARSASGALPHPRELCQAPLHIRHRPVTPALHLVLVLPVSNVQDECRRGTTHRHVAALALLAVRQVQGKNAFAGWPMAIPRERRSESPRDWQVGDCSSNDCSRVCSQCGPLWLLRIAALFRWHARLCGRSSAGEWHWALTCARWRHSAWAWA